MKILFFIESLQSGGKERRLVELIKGLSTNKDIIIELVLTRNEIHYKEILGTNIKIRYAIRKNLKKDPRIFLKFYKIAKEFKPDIIHVWGNMVAFYAIPTKLILRIPIVNNQITDAPLNVSNSIIGHKSTFPFSNIIVANSYAGLKSYNAPKHKSRVVYNGFDFNRIRSIEPKENVKKRLDLKSEFIVGMVATYNEKKDYITYIKAANLILSNTKFDITFICVGAGDFKIYEDEVSAENKNKVLFFGKQSNIENIMNICDIGVLMTNSDMHGEGISNALLEFSALGKPLIGTNGGGTPELIIDEKNGFLIENKDFVELSNKISKIILDQDLKNRLGNEAYENVKRKFSISKMISDFTDIYTETLNNY